MERCWARTGLGSHWLYHSPEQDPFSPQGNTGRGQGRDRQVWCWICPLSLAVVSWGESRREPWPKGAVGELWRSSGMGEALVRAMGQRQAPAKHAFQSVVSGRIHSGTIYFPIATALADSASVAGPTPCSGAHFLIRKRI